MDSQQGRLSCIPEDWFAGAWRCNGRTCVTWTDIKQTYHLRVTWPFWTRFMLKPTVGMELWPSISAGTSEEGAHGCATQPKWTLSKQCRRPALPEDGADALDGELAALDESQSFRRRRRRRRRRRNIDLVASAFPKREGTHRQNPQQRCLASVLQSDHGDVHLGRPAR